MSLWSLPNGISFHSRQTDTLEWDEQTIAPEEATAIESKIESFKITENWAKKEKQKATREL